MLVLSNNERVVNEFEKRGVEVLFLDLDVLGLLRAARDRVHLGARLLSHPLSGSIKPNENPYKSLLLDELGGNLDEESLSIIENSIIAAEKFLKMGKRYIDNPREYEDYASVDLSLILSAFANL